MVRVSRYIAGLTGFALVAVTPAGANDSTAEIGAGGIVLAQNYSVEMQSEVLYISMDEVRVDYVFRNRSERDVETLVAFPMPDMDVSPYYEVAIPNLDDNFLGFTVTVDGQSIQPELQQRAYVAGVDVTDKVLAAGLPLAPIGDYDGLDVSHLSDAQIEDLQAWGIVTVQGDLGKAGGRPQVDATWTLKSAYWWRMNFPAGVDVAVEHSYTPAVGGAAGLFVLGDGTRTEPHPYYADKFCVDKGFMSAVRKRDGTTDSDGPRYSERWLSYVLSSGANWAGPIGTFKLIVDKGSTENLVSFCGERVTKTGPTTFEMDLNGFLPEKDLDFLFIVAPES
ncbi:MAG: hypothetical protein CL535_00185 [Ahrensia sp.]|nr:hypothetical protein [Ahrensia sp.]|tara:strand:- start:6116 stop:7123 length:1008 start_codon:yes stop_codon:yes gene_type:complete